MDNFFASKFFPFLFLLEPGIQLVGKLSSLPLKYVDPCKNDEDTKSYSSVILPSFWLPRIWKSALALCVCRKHKPAPVTHRVASWGNQHTAFSATQFSWAARRRRGSHPQQPSGLAACSRQCRKTCLSLEQVWLDSCPFLSTWILISKDAFWSNPFTRGGEDIRLKAADCPGDWAHWGGTLERQWPGRPGARGVWGGGRRVCRGKPQWGSLWFHMLVNHTHNYEHRKFNEIQGLINPLGWMSYFSKVCQRPNLLCFPLPSTCCLMAAHEMLVYCSSEISQGRRKSNLLIKSSSGYIACTQMCMSMIQPCVKYFLRKSLEVSS